MFRKHSKLYQDPHIAYPVDNLELDFADYITKSKKIIEKYHYAYPHYPEKVMETVPPFELRPENPVFSEKNPHKIKCGALLIHGLLDTPFLMKDIGANLQSQGLLVRSIMLPGHGSVPGSLLNVDYEDWVQAVRYGVATLEKEVDQIYLVGFSTGAALALYYILKNPTHIAGLVSVSPAFEINSPFAPISNWYRGISWAWPRAAWLHVAKEIDYTKYSSMPFNAVYQVYRLTKIIEKLDHVKPLPCPIFMTLSDDDLITKSSTSINYFRLDNFQDSKMILYAQHAHNYDDARIIVRSSIYPEWHIINFSHICLPFSPTNPHYGVYGDYPLASHVNEISNIDYSALDRPHKMYYDLLYKLKLSDRQRQRLTFNPDFEFLMQRMGEFIYFSSLSSRQ